LPVATNAVGVKLSKQTQAAAVNPLHGSAALAEVLQFLGHPVPPTLRGAPLVEFWQWAVSAWSIARVPAVRGIFPGDSGQCLSP
jgi:glutamyl-Q tRNA(Asp) synthetase